MRLPLPVSLLLLSLSAPLLAQTRFCIGGELDHLSSMEKIACQTKAAHLSNAAQQHGAPADWHFIVVCDEAGWIDYASFAGRPSARTVHAGYSTDRDMHLTVVRGSRLDTDDERAAELVLSAALKGLPAAPHALPNPERLVRPPAQQIAEAHTAENDEVAGQ